MRWWHWLRQVERRTRPRDPEFEAAMARRWASLPETARTPGQVLGRHGVGCEGTHGVFPKCNLKCTPCYHSRDANQVRVDGGHTLAEVTAQMGLLRRLRGPRAHAQLIGGEVTLLPPDDHAATLLAMREHGREPMSFTHGDVDDDYLDALVLGPDGKKRLDRVSFAAHFDMFMYGRRGIARPADEAALDPYRQRFADQLRRLRRRARGAHLRRAQHDGHAGQRRPGRRRRALDVADGLRAAVVPARGLPRRRAALEGRVPQHHRGRGVGADRGRRRCPPGRRRPAAGRRAVQPHRVRLLRRLDLAPGARR